MFLLVTGRYLTTNEIQDVSNDVLSVSERLYISGAGVGRAVNFITVLKVQPSSSVQVTAEQFWVGPITKESTVHTLHNKTGDLLLRTFNL